MTTQGGDPSQETTVGNQFSGESGSGEEQTVSADSDLWAFCSELERSIVERYRKNRSKTLRDVYEMDLDFQEVDSKVVGFIADNREKILSVLNDAEMSGKIFDVFVNHAMEFTLRSNQFFPFDANDRIHLEKIYREYLDDIYRLLSEEQSVDDLTKGLRRLLEDHFGILSENIARYIDSPSGENFVFVSPVCNEYSPELQLEALGIDEQDLQEPILDIGCGFSGKLVKYLKEQGFTAIGVDRSVEKSDFLFRMDWFEVCGSLELWGTVISHMAFSNHFIFHHVNRMADIVKYAAQYKAVLSSLQPGGFFYYTPGLPFIEQFLSLDEYNLTRHTSRSMPSNETSLAASLGCDVLYSARVQKIRSSLPGSR